MKQQAGVDHYSCLFLEGETTVTEQPKKQQWQPITIILLALFFFVSQPLASFANVESELNFFVTPVLPESQLEGGATSYYDLNLGAGEQEELQMRLKNTTDDPIAIEVSVHTAFTNVNGQVEYGVDAETPDPTLSFSVDSLIETPGIISLDPQEEQVITMDLRMPEEEFEGVLAGSIRIEEVDSNQAENQDAEGLGIRNAYAFIVGVVISNNRSVTESELELLDVFADQVNYRNVFSATIQNFTPTFVNHLEVVAEVRASGSDDILYEAHRTGMQMAPNSHMHFPISLNGDRFRSGNYVLTMSASSEGKVWEWNQDFRVEAADARRLNNEYVTLEPETNWWLIGGVTTLVLAVLIIVVLIIKKKRNAKEGGDQ